MARGLWGHAALTSWPPGHPTPCSTARVNVRGSTGVAAVFWVTLADPQGLGEGNREKARAGVPVPETPSALHPPLPASVVEKVEGPGGGGCRCGSGEVGH